MHPQACELASMHLFQRHAISLRFCCCCCVVFLGRRRHRHQHHHSSWNNFSKCHVPIYSHQLPFFMRLWAESKQHKHNKQSTFIGMMSDVYIFVYLAHSFIVIVMLMLLNACERKNYVCGNFSWHMLADWIERQLMYFTQTQN